MFYIEQSDRDTHTGLNSSCIKKRKEGKPKYITLGRYWKSCQSAFSAELRRSAEETKTCWTANDCVSESVRLMILTDENIKVSP